MTLTTPTIDILLYIALGEEFNDLYEKITNELNNDFKPLELEDLAVTIFFGKIFSPVLNRDFQMAIAPAGKMGNNHAATVTSAILSKYHVSDVVVLGIAGSLSNDLQLGDVFIPDSINAYFDNSATKGKGKRWTLETSGNHYQTDRRLLNRFQLFKSTQKDYYDKWVHDCAKQFELLIDSKIQKAITKAGLEIHHQSVLVVGDDRRLASGPAVGKGKAFVEWIKREVDRKVAAMEMESAGVFDATELRTPAPRVISIRGISDFADERKDLIEDSAKQQFRELAAKNALATLLRGIEAGLFKRDGTQENRLTIKDGDVQVESRINSVFVIGGVTEESSDRDAETPRLNIACFKLGQAIAKAHAQLIICSPFPNSADYYTAMGFSEVEEERVIHFHSPNHPDVAEKRKLLSKTLGKPGLKVVDWLYPAPENKESWSQAWLLAQLQAFERADVVVAIGGKVSNTANTLLHLAEGRNIPVIAYSFLGGAAQRSFQRQDWERLHPGFDKGILEQDNGVESVIAIANRLATDLLSHRHSANKPQTFFISRATHDFEIADVLTNWLRAHGYDVLLGDEEIRDNQMATASIYQALLKSDVCIVLWSKQYALSPWCYDELMLAINRRMNIWLFNLDNSMIVPQNARKLNSISVRNASEIVKIASDLLTI